MADNPSKVVNREMVLVERKVIDEKLIREAVLEELEGPEGGTAPPKPDDIVLADISDLMLSFKNIYSIDNLLGFEKLTKLQLDNNIIEDIKNLGHLVNLKWLDLSFNNITVIENLDKLTNLEDLSLFNNKITQISGLEKLTKLNVLSLGNNSIADLGDIRNLREFQNLRLLNLKGNPVCSDDDYHNTVFAYLTNLKYLDYELIDPSQFQKAKDSKLGGQLVDLEEKEKIRAQQEKEKAKDLERQALLAEANIAGMEMFFDTIMEEDAESKQIMKLPGSVKTIAAYRAKFEAQTSAFVAAVLETHSEKNEEKSLFLSVRENLLQENENKSIEFIQQFEARKKVAFRAYKDSIAAGVQKLQILEDLKVDVEALYDELMDLEMLLVEQVGDIIDEFAENYSKFVVKNSNRIGETFKELGEAASWYTGMITTLVTTLMERIAKEEKPFDDQMEVYQLLSDRESIKSAVQQSADNHMSKIQATEDSVREREEGGGKQLMESIRSEEMERNRHRVAEITELVKSYNTLVDERLDFDAIEEDDFRYADYDM